MSNEQNQIEKAPDRLAVLARIKEKEQQGLFDENVEIDPPTAKIDYATVDFIKKKLSSRIKAKYAEFLGYRFYEGMLKRKEVVFGQVNGLENLQDFKGGAVVTSNHFSVIENYCVLRGLEKAFPNLEKNFWRVVREGNWSFKGAIGTILRHSHTLPISTDNRHLLVECMKATKTLLERGDKILIYPEQSMWWNYRKPRPLKPGAFVIAARAKVPVIPCFISMKDTDIIGKDGFLVQEYTLNILPVIKYDEKLTEKENAEIMREQNEKLWQEIYKQRYPDAEKEK